MSFYFALPYIKMVISVFSTRRSDVIYDERERKNRSVKYVAMKETQLF
jgi:hypothetical protein